MLPLLQQLVIYIYKTYKFKRIIKEKCQPKKADSLAYSTILVACPKEERKNEESK